MIQNQVKLPLKIALDVTLQGIRIRMGRSLVTVMGVMFGIAFLMSILTGIAVRHAVQSEEDTRVALRQMYNFLVDEIGSPKERKIGVIQRGELSELEIRFLAMIGKEGIKEVRWYIAGGARPQIENVYAVEMAAGRIDEDASAVIMIGDPEGSPAFVWKNALLASARQKVVATTRGDYALDAGNSVAVVKLRTELSAEIKSKIAEEARMNRFRNMWIIIIALLVTIIGISNSMLMSVTERFREIGTMKCLGALSAFVRQMFFFEAILVGCAGSVAGAVIGGVFALIVYGAIYGFGTVFLSVNYLMLASYFFVSLVAGTLMAVVAAIYPAQFASRMVPATALRSNI